MDKKRGRKPKTPNPQVDNGRQQADTDTASMAAMPAQAMEKHSGPTQLEDIGVRVVVEHEHRQGAGKGGTRGRPRKNQKGTEIELINKRSRIQKQYRWSTTSRDRYDAAQSQYPRASRTNSTEPLCPVTYQDHSSGSSDKGSSRFERGEGGGVT